METAEQMAQTCKLCCSTNASEHTMAAAAPLAIGQAAKHEHNNRMSQLDLLFSLSLSLSHTHTHTHTHSHSHIHTYTRMDRCIPCTLVMGPYKGGAAVIKLMGNSRWFTAMGLCTCM
jgi:hypothetical protein